MDSLTVIAIAFGLSFDTFAASLTFGIVRSKILFLEAFRLAMVMAVFQGGFTVSGYFAGTFVSGPLSTYDHFIALGLLAFIGIRMIAGGLRGQHVEEAKDYTKPPGLFLIAAGTSIDAAAVGISFALLDGNIWFAGVIIGAVTFLASMTAIRIGKSAGRLAGSRTEIIGGIILVVIGIRIFLEHMLDRAG